MPTILVAEDHGTLRNLVVSVLRSSGYQVMEADNGLGAVNVADAHRPHGTIDLLVTDVDMPFLLGPEAEQRIRKLYPSLKTILMSGREAADMQGAVPGATFLQKPFTRTSLLTAVRQLLA